MTTRVLTTHDRPVQRTSLEELVDRLIDAIFPQEETAPPPTVARTVHDARRLRQSGDLDGVSAKASACSSVVRRHGHMVAPSWEQAWGTALG